MVYSDFFECASTDIGNNGFKILSKKKYSDVIKKTVFIINGTFVKVRYLDIDGHVVAENLGGMREWYPEIGEVIELSGTFTVKDARAAMGWTQTHLAKLSNVNLRQIQKIEGGECKLENITAKTLLSISAALNLDPRNLI